MKQFYKTINNHLPRNDKHDDILSGSVLDLEKHVNSIKIALEDAHKKLTSSLVDCGSGNSSLNSSNTNLDGNTSIERKLNKKYNSSSLGLFFSVDSSSLDMSILGKVFNVYTDLNNDAIRVLRDHEEHVKDNIISQIRALLDTDLPVISKSRKTLNKANSDLIDKRAKLESSRKSLANSTQYSQAQVENKLDALKSDVEDCELRLLQCTVKYSIF